MPVYHLNEARAVRIQRIIPHIDKSGVERHKPNTSNVFSGKRFPVPTPSSMDDQRFFLEPSLLVGLLPLLPFPPEFWLMLETRCPIATMSAVSFQLLWRRQDV
jgi:hypothetical protein